MPSRSLRSPLVVVVLACCAPLQAQTTTTKKAEPDGRWRLEHRLEKPLLYLSRIGPALVDPLPLLNDPVMQRLLRQRGGGYGAGRYSALLQPLARLLSNQSQDMELALTRMVQAVNADSETPSLIFRCQLVPESAGQVGKVLKESLAVPSRKLHGQQVYRLKAPPKSRHDHGDQGTPVEVVLAGNNLVVSTDPAALGQAIRTGTTASAKVLSKNPRYTDLRKRIEVPKGAVMLYAHWGKLGPRLSRMVETEFGLPWRWSGLADTDRVLLVIRPARRGSDGFVTSVLLGRRPLGPPPPRWPKHWPWGHDGWLQAVQPARPARLIRGLYASGVGSLAVAVDPHKLLGPAGRGPRMQRLQAWIFGHAHQVGLDVRRQIISRLDKIGGVQVMLVPGEGVVPRVAYSFEAKTARQARDLVTDLKKALANSGRALARELDSGKKVLQIKSPRFGGWTGRRFGGHDYAFLGAVGKVVYFTFDRSTMEQLVKMSRKKPRQPRLRLESAVKQYLKQLGAVDKKVAGIFAVDLTSIAARVIGKAESEPGLFGMHAGYFTVEQDLVRLEVFSPR